MRVPVFIAKIVDVFITRRFNRLIADVPKPDGPRDTFSVEVSRKVEIVYWPGRWLAFEYSFTGKMRTTPELLQRCLDRFREDGWQVRRV